MNNLLTKEFASEKIIADQNKLLDILSNRRVESVICKTNQLHIYSYWTLINQISEQKIMLGFSGKNGWEEFPIGEIAFDDLMKFVGFNKELVLKFIQENIGSIWEPINQWLSKRPISEEVKLVTSFGTDGNRYIKGITSPKYLLIPDEQVIDLFLKNERNKSREPLVFSHAHLNESSSEFVFLTQRDKEFVERKEVGSIVQTGIKIINSEGTRKSCVEFASYLYRLICSNGATGAVPGLRDNKIHVGKNFILSNMIDSMLINNERLLDGIDRMYLPVDHAYMHEKIVPEVFDSLENILGKKESIELQEQKNHLDWMVPGDAWNFITAYAKYQSREKRISLERYATQFILNYSGIRLN